MQCYGQMRRVASYKNYDKFDIVLILIPSLPALCNQKPDTELCSIRERAFFYNAATQNCERFTYGGCERTHNHFSTIRECRETCRGVTDICSTSIRCPPGTRCKINENSGNPFCEASCEYDNGGCEADEICRMQQPQCIITFPCPEVVECLPRASKEHYSRILTNPEVLFSLQANPHFLHGTTLNNVYTYELSSSSSLYVEVCAQEADVGDCRAAIRRYYHNRQSGRCEEFSYGGCRGNDNRFITLEECQEACGVENPCSLIDCTPDNTCIVNSNGEVECVSSSSCLVNPCPPGFACQRDPATNTAECVSILIPIDSCANFHCEPGFTCEVNELGVAVCTPSETPCDLILCDINSICRNRAGTNGGYCGPDPCDTHICEQGTECRYNRELDAAKCVPTAPCLLQDCPRGQVCKLIEERGIGVCAPPDLRCMIFTCPEGTVCQPKKGIRTTVECVPENPCSRIDCGSQLCRIDQKSGRGYCGVDPCTLVRCANCEYDPVIDGPHCTGDPCASHLCADGTMCRVDENGEPECVRPCEGVVCGSLMCRVSQDTRTSYCGLNPCASIRCEAGTKCRLNMELDEAECVAVDPCANMDCSEGTTCEVDADTGEARCVLDVPDIRCLILGCSDGFVCQVNADRTVECVPEDPCSGRNCGALLCRIEQGTRTAYCGVDPCISTTCKVGSECRYNPDLDAGECMNPTDPCGGCTNGAICRMNPITREPFCGITPCAFTSCIVGSDCVYDPTTDSGRCIGPSNPCDGFTCTGGDICRVNSNTQLPFCGVDFCTIITCALGTRCNHNPLTDTVSCDQIQPPPLFDVCSDVQCGLGRKCEENERSVAECVHICADILCGRPLLCRVNTTTQEPYCGLSACRNINCSIPGTRCVYDYETDGPICSTEDSTPTDVCDPIPCPRDYRCVRNTRGNAECLLLITIG